MQNDTEPPNADVQNSWCVFPTDPEQSKTLLRDLSVFNSLPETARSALEEYYHSTQRPHRIPDGDTRKALSQTASVRLTDIESVLRLFRYLFAVLASGENTLADIQADPDTLDIQPQCRARLIALLSTSMQAHPELSRNYHEDLASSLTLPTVDTFSVSENLRAVYDNNDNLISCIPVAIVRIAVKELNEKKEVVFQATQETLDEICDILEKHRAALAEFANKAILNSEETKP